MSFKQGDIIQLKGMDEALWRIDSLGLKVGSTEDETTLSLFLPEPQLPRCVYQQNTWSHRDFMLHVAAMEVIARTVSAPSEREAQQIEQKFRSRVRRLQQLHIQAHTFKKRRERDAARARLKKFKEKNQDLFRAQKIFKFDWEFSTGV